MSASNGRPLGATGNRSGAAAAGRRAVRNHWFVVRSSWVKTTLPANSLTAVAAPGDAIVSAWAAGAATPSTARAEARTRRRRDMPRQRMSAGGRHADRSEALPAVVVQPVEDVEGGDVLHDLLRGGGAEEDGGDLGVAQGEGDCQLGRRGLQLRTEDGELVCRGERGRVLGVVALVRDSPGGVGGRVLGGERAARERGRGENARPGRLECVDSLRILDRRAPHEAVRK